MPKYYQGRFEPQNPNKYAGDPKNIIYRSSWEAKVMRSLDLNPNVLNWASEEIIVPYVSPVDKRLHRYFPDFLIKLKTGDKVEIVMIEVKPKEQRSPPVLKEGKKITRGHKRKVVTYAINKAKWQAAEEYCAMRGWKFMICDEHSLGIKK